MSDGDPRFEEALRQRLAAHGEEVEIPEGLGRGGIRRARRRTARRVGAVGVPAVVAAVVLVIVLSGGSRTHPTSAVDASEIVKRVSAQAAAVGAGGGVLATESSGGGQAMQEWAYTDPRTHVRYDYIKSYDGRGKYLNGYWNRGRPVGHGKIHNVALEIHPLQKTYGTQAATTKAQPSSEVGVQSTARQIVKELTRGKVILDGTVEFKGHQALRLRLAASAGPGTRVLYVDADTYRPIEEVIHLTPRGQKITDRLSLLPATPENIALAADRPDLTGYRHD